MKAKNKLLTPPYSFCQRWRYYCAINKAIQVSAISKNLLAEPEPLCFKWRLGNVHYTKEGTGKPLLLIHDLDTISSGVMSGNSSFRFSVMNTPFTLSTCWDLDVPRKRI